MSRLSKSQIRKSFSKAPPTSRRSACSDSVRLIQADRMEVWGTEVDEGEADCTEFRSVKEWTENQNSAYLLALENGDFRFRFLQKAENHEYPSTSWGARVGARIPRGMPSGVPGGTGGHRIVRMSCRGKWVCPLQRSFKVMVDGRSVRLW